MTLLSANQNAYIFRANDNQLYQISLQKNRLFLMRTEKFFLFRDFVQCIQRTVDFCCLFYFIFSSFQSHDKSSDYV